jgi:hypothetical protein
MTSPAHKRRVAGVVVLARHPLTERGPRERLDNVASHDFGMRAIRS